jgi:ectoine hydroxylase-related dioxygenase (phytanoyl-CoA dioxygenase family)
MTETPVTTANETIEEFHAEGFTAVHGLLTEEEAARYRKAALRAVDGGRKDPAGGTGVIATTDAWEHDPDLRDLALHPRLGAVAEELAGMPLRIWGGEVAAKPPDETAMTGLHDDLSFALLDARITLNAWVALGDVPAERGCLRFLPGSHRRPGPYRVDLPLTGIDFAAHLFGYWPDLEWSRRVTVPLRAGDATFHHSRTVHEAGGNHTDEIRLGFIVTFTDAEATYRPHPDSDPLPLQAGRPIPGDRYPRVART